MASMKTIMAKLGAEKRAEEVRKSVSEEYAKSHPSIPRNSSRWMGRNKGLPFSRMLLKDTIPAQARRPAQLVLVHPTRNTSHVKLATPAMLAVFFPSIPENLAAIMLGH